MSGPLTGLRVVELAGIGPAPFAAMVLSDLGADVVRIDRPQRIDARGRRAVEVDVIRRGRRSVAIDLKTSDGVELARHMIERADALLEGFRPGVMERLGLGPDICLDRNPRLVYARMTGWGQEGPLAAAAGHDINFIALSGALEAIGREGSAPVPPLNLVGDNGGGGMVLAFGVMAALWEAQRSGRGQVVDAAIVDGSALLTANFYGFRAAGRWNPVRGSNQCTGAPFYETYRTKDDKYIAVGSQESPFYAELLRRLGFDEAAVDEQWDTTKWATMKRRFAEVFATRTRAEWCEELEGTDSCFAPVLSFDEAHLHPHNVARGTFVERDGVVQPAPAPRFSRTAAAIARGPAVPGADTRAALADWGLADARLDELLARGVVVDASEDNSHDKEHE
jgi:alpha-methylacyl-CoA racemase